MEVARVGGGARPWAVASFGRQRRAGLPFDGRAVVVCEGESEAGGERDVGCGG